MLDREHATYGRSVLRRWIGWVLGCALGCAGETPPRSTVHPLDDVLSTSQPAGAGLAQQLSRRATGQHAR